MQWCSCLPRWITEQGNSWRQYRFSVDKVHVSRSVCFSCSVGEKRVPCRLHSSALSTRISIFGYSPEEVRAVVLLAWHASTKLPWQQSFLSQVSVFFVFFFPPTQSANKLCMVTFAVENGCITVSFSYNAKYVEVVRGVPGRTYNPSERKWSAPLASIDSIVEIFTSIGVRVPESFVKQANAAKDALQVSAILSYCRRINAHFRKVELVKVQRPYPQWN